MSHVPPSQMIRLITFDVWNDFQTETPRWANIKAVKSGQLVKNVATFQMKEKYFFNIESVKKKVFRVDFDFFPGQSQKRR